MPSNRGWSDSPQSGGNPIIKNNPPRSSPLIRTFIHSSSCLYQAIFSLRFSSLTFSLIHNPPIKNEHVLPQQQPIPMYTVCHSRLINCFTKIQHQHNIFSTFSISKLYSHTALAMDLSVPNEAPSQLPFKHHASIPYGSTGHT